MTFKLKAWQIYFLCITVIAIPVIVILVIFYNVDSVLGQTALIGAAIVASIMVLPKDVRKRNKAQNDRHFTERKTWEMFY